LLAAIVTPALRIRYRQSEAAEGSHWGIFSVRKSSRFIDTFVTQAYGGIMNRQDTRTQAYWEDEDGQGWVVTLRWSGIAGRQECVGLEIRSWCDNNPDAYLTGDHRSLNLIGAPARRLDWNRVQRMPLHTIMAAQCRRAWPSGDVLEFDSQLGKWQRVSLGIGAGTSRRKIADWLAAAPDTGHSRSRITADEWQLVDDVARDAARVGAPKSRAVALALGITNPTKRDLARMRKLIERARKRRREDA
jgi:hypothetical protein